MDSKKKPLLINFVACFLFIIIYGINIIMINNEENLINFIILDIILGVLYIFLHYRKLGSLKDLYRNIEFIFGLCFFIYSIIGSIIFVLDDYSPRFYYFRINEIGMCKTLSIYISVLSIYGFLCFFLNRIKKIDYDKMIENNIIKLYTKKSINVFFDLLTLFATVANVSKILRYGSSFWSFSTGMKRTILNSGISHYLNLYMVVYSLYIVLKMIKLKEKKSSMKFQIFFTSIYWLVFLTCERRLFVTFFLGAAFILLKQVNKIKFKSIFIFICLIFIFLFSAAIRDNISLRNHSLIDVIYSSSTEFYCTFMISEAYVQNPPELTYGKTYIIDSLEKIVPRGIYSNKSLDLSMRFKEQYNTNVGFAFNPVAEGILNFGDYAPFFVAIIMILITSFAHYMCKKNILYYIIILAFSLDFCRGAFSNLFFDILFCFIIIFIIYNVTMGKKEKYDFDN